MTATSEQLAPWRAVRSHADLGRATAAWLRGEHDFYPTYGDPRPAEETTPLLEQLAAMNDLAFATDDSQPGVAIVNGGGQRAFVTGYSDAETAALVMQGTDGSDLVVVAFPPGGAGAGQIPVSLDAGEECAWCGIHGPDDYSYIYRPISVELDEVIRSGWTLHILDPVWGRNDYLWPRVLDALEEGGDR